MDDTNRIKKTIELSEDVWIELSNLLSESEAICQGNGEDELAQQLRDLLDQINA